jgi:hypothetical protein
MLFGNAHKIVNKGRKMQTTFFTLIKIKDMALLTADWNPLGREAYYRFFSVLNNHTTGNSFNVYFPENLKYILWNGLIK